MTGGFAHPRERRVVIGGVIVLALSLLITYGALPVVTRWRTREVRLDRIRAQVSQLRELEQPVEGAPTAVEEAGAGAGPVAHRGFSGG